MPIKCQREKKQRMDVTDDAHGPLDPRIQIELENLNTATDDINKLEIELDEAETSFNHWQSESLEKLKEIMNKVGAGHVEKARCYYDAIKLAQQAQLQSQHQAHLYERASEIHATAKETVALAEARFISHKHEWNFDQAWQDMLNHATIKVRDAEDKKAICGREHQAKTMLFEDANKKAQQLEEKYRRAIIKARPFFDQQDNYEQEVITQRAKISCLKNAIKDAKRAYSKSFRALEEISNEIHQQRRDYVMMVNGPREPGVGAELVNNEGSMNYEKELNNIASDRMICSTSGSGDPDTVNRPQDITDVLGLNEQMENIGGRSVDGSESTSNQWELELQASLEKLNTLTIKNANWNSSLKNANSSSILRYNTDSVCNFTNNSPMLDQAMQHNYSQLKKLPINFQTMDKISLNNDDKIGINQGWQSLTQSPINSILNKSKIAIRNSLSKSLNNSPVNIGFNFGNRKFNNSLSSVDSHNATIIVNDTIIDNVTLLKNNQKESQDTNNTDDNIELIVPINQFKTTSVNNINVTQKQSCDKVDDENGNCSEGNNLSKDKSLPVNKMRDDCLLDNRSDLKFVNNATFNETTCKVSSIKELPILSMFKGSSNFHTPKDKSCSMINLTGKPNSKSAMGNIQAISVERLANARHILMAEHVDTKSKLSRQK